MAQVSMPARFGRDPCSRFGRGLPQEDVMQRPFANFKVVKDGKFTLRSSDYSSGIIDFEAPPMNDDSCYLAYIADPDGGAGDAELSIYVQPETGYRSQFAGPTTFTSGVRRGLWEVV
ncbi:MAG TPA: hypothetical protein VFU59_08920, partial [Candidatus Eisenbacteria bacterium]|nr:hypothetical protein [Candidatus Eisenbacteria bacterium]